MFLLPLMDKITSWNVRDMNGPNKQEDLKIFLTQHQIGLVGLLAVSYTHLTLPTKRIV